ncbi:MAG TPA: hypothetical protein VGH66_13675, partial [Acidimicrobiales bacterium]
MGFLDGTDSLEQRQHGRPLDVVADRVLEDLLQGVPMMVVERWGALSTPSAGASDLDRSTAGAP